MKNKTQKQNIRRGRGTKPKIEGGMHKLVLDRIDGTRLWREKRRQVDDKQKKGNMVSRSSNKTLKDS